MTLIAYHNRQSDKDAILAQLQAHKLADEIVHGRYWQDGKGCAVGCTIHSGRHAEYEPQFGIPQMLARLEDTIFEGMSNGYAKDWPIDFMSAIQPGADLSLVGWQFLHWLLTDETVNPGINHLLVKDAVKRCADVLAPMTKGLRVNASAADSAARAAYSAAYSAAAARAAARAATSAYSAATRAYSAATRAAYSAAYSADSAAYSAASAAYSADASADSAAYSAASAADYRRMAAKLIELMCNAPLASEAA